jgi:hypothetical protein
MTGKAKAPRLLAVMMPLVLALFLAIAPTAAAADATFDADGVWGISEQGTDGQGASCDRWATGPGSSPSAVSDTDPGIQSPPTNDENHIRYGAEDTDAADCHPFANQSGFGFDGVDGARMPTDGTSFKLGAFIQPNGRVNMEHQGFNPLTSVGLTITLSGGIDAVLECTMTLDETANDDVPCKYPDAPNDPPCGERVTVASQPTTIAIEGKQYTLEIVGFTDCDAPGTPSEIFYTQEQAASEACLYARLVEPSPSGQTKITNSR